MATRRHESSATRITRVAFALALACVLVGAPSAFAQTKTSDVIAGKTAAKRKLSAKKLPDVDQVAGVLVTESGDMLWARKADERRPMASITKIMTALVAIENSTPDEIVTVAHSAAPGESNVGLKPGDKLPMKVLLEGLLVKSGGDAARAIAEHVGGSEAQFVKMMNAKAKKLGLKDTSFSNPHGLDAKNHYASASDLEKLTRNAMKNPQFRRIVKLTETKVDGRSYTTTDRLLASYPGAIGVKTGFTDGAKYSIVSGATRDGRTLYAVVLGSPSDAQRFADARTLLDWGFQHVIEQRLVSEGAYVGTVPVRDYLDTSVGALAGSDATATVFDLRGPITSSVELDEGIKAPVERGTRVGEVTFTQDGRRVGSVELVASRDIPAPTALERVGIGLTRTWRTVFGPREGAPQPVVVAAP